VLLCRVDAHAFDGGCFKLFIDPAAMRLAKRAAFNLSTDVSFPSDAETQRLLGVSSQDLRILVAEYSSNHTRRAGSATCTVPQAAVAAVDVPGFRARAQRAIVRAGRALFVGTTYGAYVVEGDRITWHHMEPDVSGRLVVISEALTN
jgi:hypothetical protein